MVCYRSVLIPLALLALAPSAYGQRFDYVSAYSGAVFLNDYRGAVANDARTGTFSDGWLLGGAIGKCLSNCNRLEGEFFYRNNGADAWITPNNNFDWSGRLNCFSTTTNLLHDFRKLSVRRSIPYAGGGIGGAFLDGEFETPAATYEIDETVFAFQGIAGIRTQLNCRTSLLTEYRYFGTSRARLTDVDTDDTAGTFGYDSHNVLIGFSIQR
ncbi:MAG: outer membrane beta-barrel protein [Pirellulaceae bacterium]|nr:outer membrane beta-barrel protein [Pirellulaceae bacterium]